MGIPAERLSLNAELRVDPTRTTVLRRQYEADMYKRFRKIKGLILKTVVEYDALDLAGNNPVLLIDVGPVRRFDVTSSSEKIQEFMAWMHRAVDSHVLGNAVREAGRIIEHDRWQEVYVKAAYKKGIIRSLSELGRQGIDIFENIAPERFFNHPLHADTLGLLIERGFEELKGVTEATLQQIQRVMADGIAQGDGPRVIARAINERVDSIGIVRARMIARTETVRAHSESTLNLYEQAGIRDVTAEVEFTSIDDERRCKRCENLTKGLTEDGDPREKGNIYTIEEARGIIPVHVQCRCAWLPVIAAIANNKLLSTNQKIRLVWDRRRKLIA